jgi:hypothetical protein
LPWPVDAVASFADDALKAVLDHCVQEHLAVVEHIGETDARVAALISTRRSSDRRSDWIS